MRILICCISLLGSINSQFVFPGQYNFPFPYFNQPYLQQQATTTTNRPYNVRVPQPYQQVPPSNTYQQSGKRISQQKCEEYSNKVQETKFAGSLGLITKIHTINAEQCDVSQGLIVGGVNAKPGEFPHMAAIGYKSTFSNVPEFKCGGSLISERFVLTAAHCSKAERADASVVRVGDLNLKVKDNGLPELEIPIERFISHEQYDKRNKKNDIAVVRLARVVPIDKFVRPACLMQPNYVFQSRKVVASGWGLTVAESRQTSDILQKVDLNLIQNIECGRFLEDNLITIDNNQLCAGVLEGGKDTCQGDSGGPLQVVSNANKCVYVVVGVTSFGISCGLRNSPGVYVKVSSYLDWIENNVWGS